MIGCEVCDIGQKWPISAENAMYMQLSYLNVYQLFGSSKKEPEMKDSYMNRVICCSKIYSQTCKLIMASILQQSQGGVAPNFRLMIMNILAICMVSRIKITLVECCLNIDNFVWSLMFFGHWHLYEWTVGCPKLKVATPVMMGVSSIAMQEEAW